MLNLFRQSDEAELERILAQHAAVPDEAGLREKQFRDLLRRCLPPSTRPMPMATSPSSIAPAVEFAGRTPTIGDDVVRDLEAFRPDGTPLAHEDCPMAIALKENRPIRNVEAVAERPDGSRICFMPYPTPLRDAEGRCSAP